MRADRLTEHMHFPVGRLAHGNKRIERPCCRPHDVAARLVVGGILHGNGRAVDERTQKPFRKIIARVVVRAREVLLENVRHNVVKSRDHLIARKREGILRIENGELREDFFAEHFPDLEFLRMVGDDGAAVHLAARTDHRQHAGNGNDLTGRLLKAEEVLLPRVLVAVDRDRNRLGIVAHRAAAHRKDEIRLAGTGARNALIQFLRRGIGHYARIFGDVFAAFL